MAKLQTKINGPLAVIGDVHGQVDKLVPILEQLRALSDYEQRWIVFIGDLVDRGPDPCGAVTLLQDLLLEHPRTTAIAGNHEFAMTASLGWIPVPDPENWAERWTDHYDSETTFESYGAAPGDLDALAARAPAEHRGLLAGLPWLVEHTQYLFVHAGLDPNGEFSTQLRILRQKDYTLNRPQWLCSKSLVDEAVPPDCPVTVVSGHVRVPQVQIFPQRILLDTTGGVEGDLSCVLLPEERVLTSSGETSAAVHSRSWWKLWG